LVGSADGAVNVPCGMSFDSLRLADSRALVIWRLML
jgi:hypothetical protein